MKEPHHDAPEQIGEIDHHVLSVIVSVFDSAMTLLDGPVDGIVSMPGPASIVCVKNVLEGMGVSRERDDALLLSYFCVF